MVVPGPVEWHCRNGFVRTLGVVGVERVRSFPETTLHQGVARRHAQGSRRRRPDLYLRTYRVDHHERTPRFHGGRRVHPVQIAVLSERDRLGYLRLLPADCGRSVIAVHEAHPSPTLEGNPPIQLCRLLRWHHARRRCRDGRWRTRLRRWGRAVHCGDLGHDRSSDLEERAEQRRSSESHERGSAPRSHAGFSGCRHGTARRRRVSLRWKRRLRW